MHFSTAAELYFSDGSTFSISPPKLAFTTATPSAFGFLSNTPAKITLTGGQLSVAEGKSLSIIGGDIALQSGSSLIAPEGRLNLASVTSRGQVVIEDNKLEVSDFSQRGHLTADQVKLKVSSNKGKGAGSIYIRGGQIELNDSQINGKPQDEDGGVIDINSNELTLSQTDLSVSTLGTGKSGNVLINADSTVSISGLENGLKACRYLVKAFVTSLSQSHSLTRHRFLPRPSCVRGLGHTIAVARCRRRTTPTMTLRRVGALT